MRLADFRHILGTKFNLYKIDDGKVTVMNYLKIL